MFIGELSQQTGVSRETIRYYEQRGLLQPRTRRQSRYREYSEEHVRLLRFILRLKGLGFTLKEIKHILQAWQEQEYSCGQAREIIERKIGVLEREIECMRQYTRDLQDLRNQCEQARAADRCASFEKLWHAC